MTFVAELLSSDGHVSRLLRTIRWHVQTYTQARPLVVDSGYEARRRVSLADLEDILSAGEIDAPIVSIIERISLIPYCFTLQSCYGHFVVGNGLSTDSVKQISHDMKRGSTIRYRLAYMAFCIQNNPSGLRLLKDLKAIAREDPEYIQFGSATWFWNRCVNSYVLQAGSVEHVSEDSFEMGIAEALRVEAARDMLYAKIAEVVNSCKTDM